MRYTEQEFKFDHIFDYIRYVASSIILAPFRIVNELTKKVIYIPLRVIERCIFTGITINLIIILWTIVSMLMEGKFSLISGKMPLLPCIISCVLLCTLQYSLTFVKNPSFKYVSEEEKTLEDIVDETEEVEDFKLEDEEYLNDETLNILKSTKNTSLDEKLKQVRNTSEELEAYENASPEELQNKIDATLFMDDVSMKDALNIGVPEGSTPIEVATEVATSIETDEFDLGDVGLDLSAIEMMNKASVIGDINFDDIDVDIDFDNLKNGG